jgi:hypothetical protein
MSLGRYPQGLSNRQRHCGAAGLTQHISRLYLDKIRTRSDFLSMFSRASRQHSSASTMRQRARSVSSASPQLPRTQSKIDKTRQQPPTAPLPPVALGGYPFTETTRQWKALPHRAGLVAILQAPSVPGQSYRPLFLTEAEDVHRAIDILQGRSALLAAKSTETIVYAALYTELVKAARRQIVVDLQALYHLPTSLPLTLPPPPSRPSRRPPARGRTRQQTT